MIQDSNFQNNTAKNGGVFSASEESVIKCYNCVINENFALTSGVINVGQNGQFEFYASRIFNNYANNNPVSLIFITALDSVFDFTEIYGNKGLKKSEIVNEFGGNCSLLCFVNQNFISYSNLNFGSVILEVNSQSILQLISSSLIFQNNSHIYDESILVKAFVSSVVFKDSKISQINLTNTAIDVIASDASFENMVLDSIFSNITNDSIQFILVLLESKIAMNGSQYQNSDCLLLKSRTSVTTLSILSFVNITKTISLFEISANTAVNISQIITSQVSVTSTYLFKIQSSSQISLIDINIEGLNKTIFSIMKSNIPTIKNMTIKGCLEGIKVVSSTIENLTDSLFERNGNVDKRNGGGLQLIDSSVTIRNSKFINNSAQIGAGIYFSCFSLAL